MHSYSQYLSEVIPASAQQIIYNCKNILCLLFFLIVYRGLTKGEDLQNKFANSPALQSI